MVIFIACMTKFINIKLDKMKTEKADIDWLISQWELSTDRYIEAENIILEVINMPWYRKIFCGKKLLSFLKKANKF